MAEPPQEDAKNRYQKKTCAQKNNAHHKTRQVMSDHVHRTPQAIWETIGYQDVLTFETAGFQYFPVKKDRLEGIPISMILPRSIITALLSGAICATRRSWAATTTVVPRR